MSLFRMSPHYHYTIASNNNNISIVDKYISTSTFVHTYVSMVSFTFVCTGHDVALSLMLLKRKTIAERKVISQRP